MHDYLRKRYSRRGVLKGAGAVGAMAAAGPVFWRRSFTDSSAAGSPTGPQWIALGPDPATEMHVSWSKPCSDGGDRYAWQPIFDRFDVDVVINGHNHLYERIYPMRGNVVQAYVGPGGKIAPELQGTTYICTGGGGRLPSPVR
jgi:hypothetical protein